MTDEDRSYGQLLRSSVNVKGEIRDYSVESVVSDLMEAGYIREISEKTVEKTKPDLQKARTTRKIVKNESK